MPTLCTATSQIVKEQRVPGAGLWASEACRPTQVRARTGWLVWTLALCARRFRSLKEVIQPQVPLRLPCYDFTPVADHTVARVFPCGLDYALLVQPTPMV